jgi:tetratricopeptide (TPR) repeat protein
MSERATSLSDAFQESVRLLMQLHHEMSNGEADGVRADIIRDAMDSPWHRLSENEQNTLRGLSADLYTIGQSWPAAREIPGKIREPIWEATGSKKWEVLLDIIRQHQAEISPDAVSYLRGVAWFHLGQLLVALEFLNNAMNTAATVLPAYIHYFFYTLTQLGRLNEAIPYAEKIIAESDEALPLLDAAEVFFAHSTEVNKDDLDRVLRIAEDAATRGLHLAESATNDKVLSLQCGLTYLWLAMSNARREDIGSANQALQKAELYIPNDPKVAFVKSWLQHKRRETSWEHGVGLGLIEMRGVQPSFAGLTSNDYSAN